MLIGCQLGSMPTDNSIDNISEEESTADPVLWVGDLLTDQDSGEQPLKDPAETERPTVVQSGVKAQPEATIIDLTVMPLTDMSLTSIPPTSIPPTSIPPVEPQFEMGNELTIATLRAREIVGSEITFEQTLENGSNYAQYIASYLSEGNRIYGLLTVPFGDSPAGGYKAVVFNHGFIPPDVYQTTERYVAYVGALASSGLVVFKIDLRGHGNSEGESSGTYFSPNYTVDAISALKSLQTLDFVDPQGIGMWGHSMAGNLVLRAMLIEPDVRAGVIWAGAVYSYNDLGRYSIDDPSANRDFFDRAPGFRRGREIREFYGQPDLAVPYWRAVSLTENLSTLQAPLQLHHAVNDNVVNIGYSVDLAAALVAQNKTHEFYRYDSGGHNIGDPAFAEAMRRTVAFYLANL